LVQRVDVDALVERVDVDHLLQRVDVDELVARIDLDALVARLNVQELVDRIDVDAIVAKVDVDALVEQTELGTIIVRSTSGVLTQFVDLARRQVVALDDLALRIVNALLRRKRAALPAGPTAKAGTLSTHPTSVDGGLSRQGTFAGPLSRFLGFLTDCGLIWFLFVASVAIANWTFDLITGHHVNLDRYHAVILALLVPWSFTYFVYQWTLGGRTLGNALFGVRVVDAEGGPIGARSAVLRTIVLPIAVFPAFLPCIGVVIGRRRRALFDLAARTVVVYDWDARASRLRWLAQKPLPGDPDHVAALTSGSGAPLSTGGAPETSTEPR